MSQEPTLYDILGVPRTARTAEIKRAYRLRIKEQHPDTLMGQKAEYENAENWEKVEELNALIVAAEERAKDINRAYKVLSNTRLRFFYDLELADPAQLDTAITQNAPRRFHFLREFVPQDWDIRRKLKDGENPTIAAWVWAAVFVVACLHILVIAEREGDSPFEQVITPREFLTAQEHYDEGAAWLASAQHVTDIQTLNALAEFNAAIVTNPDFAIAYREIGFIYVRFWEYKPGANYRDLALRYLRRYVELTGDAADPEALHFISQLE